MDLPSCCVNINLSDNKIDDVGLIQLGRVIKESATLNVLNLARQKIIKYHMLKDDGIDVGVFIGMELNKLPSAVSWMGRERDDIGLSVLYQLCKSLPCLFESNLKVAGLKRKRE